MNHDDIIELLQRLWEHFDSTADINSDGSPNESLRLCAEIDATIGTLSALKREHEVLTEMANDPR